MFYDNLKSECEKQGLKVSSIVAECGGAVGSIAGWKKGAMPNSSIVIALALRLNVTTDYLLIGKFSENISSDEQELLTIYNKLSNESKIRVKERAQTLAEIESPELARKLQKGKAKTLTIKCSSYRVSAGTGFELGSDDEWYEIEVFDTHETRRADFALEIKGNSMEPIYFDGDIVLVKEQPAVDVGEIGIFSVEGNGYIKKYGGDRLISLNSEYSDIVFFDYDEDSIRCFGKVIGRA